jgi:hypothetical protein
MIRGQDQNLATGLAELLDLYQFEALQKLFEGK